MRHPRRGEELRRTGAYEQHDDERQEDLPIEVQDLAAELATPTPSDGYVLMYREVSPGGTITTIEESRRSEEPYVPLPPPLPKVRHCRKLKNRRRRKNKRLRILKTQAPHGRYAYIHECLQRGGPPPRIIERLDLNMTTFEDHVRRNPQDYLVVASPSAASREATGAVPKRRLTAPPAPRLIAPPAPRLIAPPAPRLIAPPAPRLLAPPVTPTWPSTTAVAPTTSSAYRTAPPSPASYQAALATVAAFEAASTSGHAQQPPAAARVTSTRVQASAPRRILLATPLPVEWTPRRKHANPQKCPVVTCPISVKSLLRYHVCDKHLPRAFNLEDQEGTYDATHRILQQRREFWTALLKFLPGEQSVLRLLARVRRDIEALDRRNLPAVPPELNRMLNTVAEASGRQRDEVQLITDLGPDAMYSWRVAATALNFISEEQREQLLMELGGPGIRQEDQEQRRRR